MMKKLIALFCFASLLITSLVYGQKNSVKDDLERRIALVIGNSSYAISPLLNPVNDARDIAAALREAGFLVTLKENLSYRDMKEAIQDFGDEISRGGVGLFYFSGHGVQINGQNYLIPIGTTIRREEEVEYESVNLGWVLAQLQSAENRLNVVILDACRNNPFPRSFRSQSRGLAVVRAPSETFIAYATAPGTVASDGAGRNSPYTGALLRYIRVPDLKIEDTFKRVRARVKEETRGNQTPWDSSSLTSDFYFTGKQEHVELQTYSETAGGADIEMVRIPAGTFTMGSPDSEAGRYPDEGPQHKVSVSSFYMGKYEVTQEQWRAVATKLRKVKIDLNPDPSYFKGENLPVEQVNWEEAIEFSERLSRATGKTYRLPTEAEWEYACRAMTTTPFAFGEMITPEIVNYNGNYPYGSAPKGVYREKTTPVGSLGRANAFGLYDMHGNVWEWCMDWYSENYYLQSPRVDPTGPSTGSARVTRGGSWLSFAQFCRSAIRGRGAPGGRVSFLGFRLVRTLR